MMHVASSSSRSAGMTVAKIITHVAITEASARFCMHTKRDSEMYQDYFPAKGGSRAP